MFTLFHIAEQPFWEAAQASGVYRVPSLDSEGFIHLSTRAQFVATANRYYVGRTDLVLLEVDELAVSGQDLRYETSTNDERFPHLYDTLSVASVVCAHIFLPSADGSFSFPTTVSYSAGRTSSTEPTVLLSDRQAGSGAPLSYSAGPTSSTEPTVLLSDRQAGSGSPAA